MATFDDNRKRLPGREASSTFCGTRNRDCEIHWLSKILWFSGIYDPQESWQRIAKRSGTWHHMMHSQSLLTGTDGSTPRNSVSCRRSKQQPRMKPWFSDDLKWSQSQTISDSLESELLRTSSSLISKVRISEHCNLGTRQPFPKIRLFRMRWWQHCRWWPASWKLLEVLVHN